MNQNIHDMRARPQQSTQAFGLDLRIDRDRATEFSAYLSGVRHSVTITLMLACVYFEMVIFAIGSAAEAGLGLPLAFAVLAVTAIIFVFLRRAYQRSVVLSGPFAASITVVSVRP